VDGLREFRIVARVELNVGVADPTSNDREALCRSPCLADACILDAYFNIVDSAIRY
jgi:hypothetical protein